MRLLDLFCGAGGAAMGYHRAGFTEIVGVDIEPQPHYPFQFVQGDALKVLASSYTPRFDLIHASPPCHRFSCAANFRRRGQLPRLYPDLLTPTLEILQRIGVPWVVENVMRAPLSPWSCVLCGLMFGLKVFRHRRFETSSLVLRPDHPSHKGKRLGVGGYCCVVGNGGGGAWRRRRSIPKDHMVKAAWERAMGIDWMTRRELSQAVPPAYTEWIGRQMRARI